MPHLNRIVALAIAFGALSTACDGVLSPESHDGVEYVVERFDVSQENVEWAPFPIAYLTLELALINTRRDSIDVSYGACTLELEAFEADEPRRSVWRSRDRLSWPSSTAFVCALGLFTARLGPGDTLRGPQLTVREPLAEILADSLPSEPYEFDALINMKRQSARLDLGRVHLPISRYPLPENVASRDGFRYEVQVDTEGETETGEASVVLDVDFTAPTQTRLERTLSAACPVRIRFFRDASDVTTIPQPEPAWSWPQACAPGDRMVSLGPGEAERLQETIDLQDLLATGGPGRYFLMGVIDVDGRPIRLSAGELDVGPAE